MSQFVYLYRGAESAPDPLRKCSKMMQKWMAWMKQLRRQRPHQGPRPSARQHWQAGQGQAEDRDRRAVCRDQRRRRRLHADRGPRSRAGGGALQGLPDLRVRGRGGSAPGHEDEHVVEIGDHLFRREAGRMVAALTRVFGVHNLALAEDVVQDAFCRALEVWKFRGVPDNPSAWLMATAKNRALDVLRRERTARTFAPELGRAARERVDAGAGASRSCSARRDQRRPAADDVLVLPSAAARGGAGRAGAAHPVRLWRQRNRQRVPEQRSGDREAHLARQEGAGGLEAAVRSRPTPTSRARLSAVQRALYLLFNEGYHGASPESAVRAELCARRMRLCALLLDTRWRRRRRRTRSPR